MGSDIHTFVEIKKNGKWQYFTGDHFSMGNFDKNYYKKEKTRYPFDWRSYRMFTFLAGVRNNGDIKPIKTPSYKLPADISDEVKNIYKEHWEGDAHGVSFLTASELSEFDYNQDIRTVDEEFSTSTRKVLNEKIVRYVNIYKADDGEKTYFDLIGGPDSMFFTHVKELSELGDLDDVRVVFWFDS